MLLLTLRVLIGTYKFTFIMCCKLFEQQILVNRTLLIEERWAEVPHGHILK